MREITEPANKIADTIIEGMRNGAAKGGNKNFNPDYTLTRPKRLRKFEKVDGVKVVKDGWVDLDKRKFDGITIPQTSKGQGRGVAGGVVNLRG
jgi:hypothetical protein